MVVPAQGLPLDSPAAPLLKIESVGRIPGRMRGIRSTLALVRLSLSQGERWAGLVDRARALLQTRLPGFASITEPRCIPRFFGAAEAGAVQFIAQLLGVLDAFEHEIGLPALDRPHALALQASTASRSCWLLVLPSYSPQATLMAFVWLVRWLEAMSRSAHRESWPAELDALIDRLNRLAPPGNNVRHFVRAAHELNIPWLVLPDGVIQYGWGKRARLLLSTFTDETPNISVRIARNKLAANQVLRAAGLPVPAQQRVRSVEAAIEAARVLGYPVVVKPANLDGGHGVAAGLGDDEELRKAFDRAAKYGREILVEKHFEGRDYRIAVFRGQPLWAMERVPAGVIGDGKQTVRQLIEQTNRDPRRGVRRWAQMKPLVVDAEAQELLDTEKLTFDSTPAAGRFVRLHRAANISSGGTPIPMFDAMHPDNAALAVRAARVLRLDLAGVDLITPDITRSWRETGAAICEINAQPQMSITSPHVYAHLLKTLVPGRGRIAAAIVLSTDCAGELVRQVARILAQRGMCLGVSDPNGIMVGGERVRDGRRSAFEDARALMMDPAVDAMLIVSEGADFRAAGAPFDRFDALALGEWADPAADPEQLARVLGLLEPHCDGEVLLSRGHLKTALAARSLGEKRLRTVSSLDQLAVRLALLLKRRDVLHARPIQGGSV
jgi:cyanophycin synthetase